MFSRLNRIGLLGSFVLGAAVLGHCGRTAKTPPEVTPPPGPGPGPGGPPVGGQPADTFTGSITQLLANYKDKKLTDTASIKIDRALVVAASTAGDTREISDLDNTDAKITITLCDSGDEACKDSNKDYGPGSILSLEGKLAAQNGTLIVAAKPVTNFLIGRQALPTGPIAQLLAKKDLAGNTEVTLENVVLKSLSGNGAEAYVVDQDGGAGIHLVCGKVTLSKTTANNGGCFNKAFEAIKKPDQTQNPADYALYMNKIDLLVNVTGFLKIFPDNIQIEAQYTLNAEKTQVTFSPLIKVIEPLTQKIVAPTLISASLINDASLKDKAYLNVRGSYVKINSDNLEVTSERPASMQNSNHKTASFTVTYKKPNMGPTPDPKVFEFEKKDATGFMQCTKDIFTQFETLKTSYKDPNGNISKIEPSLPDTLNCCKSGPAFNGFEVTDLKNQKIIKVNPLNYNHFKYNAWPCAAANVANQVFEKNGAQAATKLKSLAGILDVSYGSVSLFPASDATDFVINTAAQ